MDISQAITLFNQGAAPATIEVKTGINALELQGLKDIGEKIRPLSEQIKEILSNQWYTVAETALQELGKRDFARIPARDLAVLAGIAQDKAREMEGKPTAVIAAYVQVMQKIMIDESDYNAKYAIKVVKNPHGAENSLEIREKAGLIEG